MSLAHYWTVHHVEDDDTCGHEHDTEASAWACLDTFDDPDKWCVYECSRREIRLDSLDDWEPFPEDVPPPPRCRFCGEIEHRDRSCKPPATGWNATLGCYV